MFFRGLFYAILFDIICVLIGIGIYKLFFS